MTKTFVAGEVTKIQTYLLKAHRLRYVEGASLLVETYSSCIIRALAHLANNGSDVYLSAAGRFLVSFNDQSEADIFYRQALYVGNVLFGSEHIVVYRPMPATPDIVEKIGKEMVSHKTSASRRGAAAMPGLQFMQRCSACNAWEAPYTIRFPEEEMVCSICYHKFQARQGEDIVIRFPDPLIADHPNELRITQKQDSSSDQWITVYYPDHKFSKRKEFKEIAEASSPPYLALFYADGNAMGEILYKTGSIEQFAEISKTTSNRNSDAVQQACGDAFEGLILIKGGDDLLVALPADQAFDFAVTYLDSINTRPTPFVKGICGGIVICSAGMPFPLVHQQVEGLVDNAKKHVRRLHLSGEKETLSPERLTALDFVFITSPLLQPVNDQPERKPFPAGGNNHYLLTAKPYLIDELKQLMASLRQLKLYHPPNRLFMQLKDVFAPGDLKNRLRDDGKFRDFEELKKRALSLSAKELRNALEVFFEKSPILLPGMETWHEMDANGNTVDAKRHWEADIVEMVDFITT